MLLLCTQLQANWTEITCVVRERSCGICCIWVCWGEATDAVVSCHCWELFIDWTDATGSREYRRALPVGCVWSGGAASVISLWWHGESLSDFCHSNPTGTFHAMLANVASYLVRQAGDRSLANVSVTFAIYSCWLDAHFQVVAHEISHSWTGNLVTNKTWEHFW